MLTSMLNMLFFYTYLLSIQLHLLKGKLFLQSETRLNLTPHVGCRLIHFWFRLYAAICPNKIFTFLSCILTPTKLPNILWLLTKGRFQKYQFKYALPIVFAIQPFSLSISCLQVLWLQVIKDGFYNLSRVKQKSDEKCCLNKRKQDYKKIRKRTLYGNIKGLIFEIFFLFILCNTV